MPYLHGQLQDFIKTRVINGQVRQNPLVVRLNHSGFDLEDLAVVTCIPKALIEAYVYNLAIPDEHDAHCLDLAFALGRGSFSEEYQRWLKKLEDEAKALA